MKTKTLLALMLTLAMALATSSASAQACSVPTGLTIELTLSFPGPTTSFTRVLRFTNVNGEYVDVPVVFTRNGFRSNQWTGTATYAGLAWLEFLSFQDMRTYWDEMSLVNAGQSGSLRIGTADVYIHYDNCSSARVTDVLIAHITNATLGSGHATLPFNQLRGRRLHVQGFLGWSRSEFDATPEPLRQFIYDLGKSGTDSNDYSGGDNPQYGLGDENLCSETVSWYYYEYGTPIYRSGTQREDFRDITFHRDMTEAFRDAGRQYCYDPGSGTFVLHGTDDRPVGGRRPITYTPQPGDYLDRLDSGPAGGDDGHAMMIVEWNPATGIAVVLDGPWAITLRHVFIDANESSGSREYCVGRIPENGGAWRVWGSAGGVLPR